MKARQFVTGLFGLGLIVILTGFLALPMVQGREDVNLEESFEEYEEYDDGTPAAEGAPAPQIKWRMRRHQERQALSRRYLIQALVCH